MERCKTCKFWRRPEMDRWWPPEVLAGGYCQNEKISEAGEHLPDALVYSYDEGGVFWTGPEFGCVHHAVTK